MVYQQSFDTVTLCTVIATGGVFEADAVQSGPISSATVTIGQTAQVSRCIFIAMVVLNVQDQRPGATDPQLSTRALSPGSLHAALIAFRTTFLVPIRSKKPAPSGGYSDAPRS